jgi:hypothetical protein
MVDLGVPSGVVSPSSFKSVIMPSKYAREFGSSNLLVVILLISTSWSIFLLQANISDSYGSSFMLETFLGQFFKKIDSLIQHST